MEIFFKTKLASLHLFSLFFIHIKNFPTYKKLPQEEEPSPYEWLTSNFSLQYQLWIKHYGHQLKQFFIAK